MASPTLNTAGDANLTASRRVARVAVEVALSLKLPGSLTRVLEEAALHHRQCEMGPLGLARLAAEVCAARPAPAKPSEAVVSSDVAEVLALLGGDRAAPGAPALQLVAEIVRLCAMLDSQLEALPFEYKHMDAILDELEGVVAFEGVRPALVESLRSFRCRDLKPEKEVWRRLPVQARQAQEVFRCLGSEREYEVRELEALAVRDPVLAGSLIQVANSALYSPERRIGTVRQAIAYIGTIAARQVLLAVVMRPLFASAGLARVWSHAVQMAQLCSALATQTGLLDPGAALLLGLVHDVGALAVRLLPRPILERYERLTGLGCCPPAYVEHLLFGCDHGEIGAGVLDGWCFPDLLIDAVRFHHQPERSVSLVTPLLYLAEFWSGLDEDLSSFVRVQECSRLTGVSLDALASVHVRPDALHLLRTVA